MNLLEERKKKNFTQREVGKLSGISESYYNMIENGERKPPVKTAKRIASVLGFSWTQFFDDGDCHCDAEDERSKNLNPDD